MSTATVPSCRDHLHPVGSLRGIARLQGLPPSDDARRAGAQRTLAVANVGCTDIPKHRACADASPRVDCAHPDSVAESTVSRTGCSSGEEMIEAILGLLPALSGLLNNTSKRRRLVDEQGKRAVETILRSVNETNLYISRLRHGEQRSRQREEQLSRHWTEAAAALHGIDDGLAQRCWLKGEHWSDPESWDEERLNQGGILLTRVAADAKALLGWQDSQG